MPKTGYGSRTVSVEIVRSRTLSPVSHDFNSSAVGPMRSASAMTSAQVADRLSLSHWPRGHQIFVCSLAGGVGRTTVAGLLGHVLADQPFGHIWPPVALVEQSSRGLSRTMARWTPADKSVHRGVAKKKPPGLPNILPTVDSAVRASHSCVIVEALAGLPSDDVGITEDTTSSLVVVSPPDRESLDCLSDALLWMAKHASISRDRITVVVNSGARPFTRSDRATITAMAIRCSSVHRLSYDPDLDLGRKFPFPDQLSRQLRRRVERIALSIWTAQDLKHSPTPKEQL